jgi:hypothetical protein
MSVKVNESSENKDDSSPEAMSKPDISDTSANSTVSDTFSENTFSRFGPFYTKKKHPSL